LEKDLFPKLAKKGSLYGFKINENFIDIGIPENYYEARRILSKKKQRIIEVTVPTRISFAGGGTDLPEYFTKHGGCVLGAAIDKYAHVKLKTWDLPQIKVKLLDFAKEETYPLGKILPYDGSIFDLYKAAFNKFKPQSGFEISVWGDFPAGSGLGSSSAIAVALIYGLSALSGKKLKNDKAARLAIELEREELKIPGGWQDQYLCSFGGLNYVEFGGNSKVRVSSLRLSKKRLKEFEENLLLFYLGGKRSEKAQQKFLSNEIQKKKDTLKALEKLKEITQKIRIALQESDFSMVGKLLNESWLEKKKSFGQISTGFIDKIYKIAKNNGAIGGKLLGAGGGGYLLVYVPQKVKEKLIKAMNRYGLKPEKIGFDLEGPKLRVYED
jgi:D-glycero-alpha-D-manno-heptose-7-phosphate kinase